MHYNNSSEIKAQKEQQSEKNRDTAIMFWVILCAMLALYIYPVAGELFGEFGIAMILMIMPVAVAVMSIYSTVLYCRAHKNVKRKDELRAGSRALLIMSLVMFGFVVVLWIKSAIEANSYVIEHNLQGTSGASGPWMSLIALAPISITSIIGALAFLIA